MEVHLDWLLVGYTENVCSFSAFLGSHLLTDSDFGSWIRGKASSGLLFEFFASFWLQLALFQLRHLSHRGYLRSWISHHDLLVKFWDLYKQSCLSQPAAFPAFDLLLSLL